MTRNRTLVVIPTYNEAENIGRLLQRLSAEVPQADVLVVDDNSPDGTQKIVTEFQKTHPHVHLLSRPGKQGLGIAYIAGFTWGCERTYDYLIEMDADFSHDPSYLPGFIEALGSADLAMGSRYISGGGTEGWSCLRQCISRGGNTYARMVLTLPYQDLTGGFNAWRRTTLEKIQFATVKSVGYAFQVELKYRTHLAGLKIVEIPIKFPDRKYGQSKMSGNIVFEAARRVWDMRRQSPPS